MENIFWPQVSEFDTSNPWKNPNPMKNISRSAQGVMGREDTKVIKNVKCKSIKRDFGNDRDFFLAAVYYTYEDL